MSEIRHQQCQEEPGYFEAFQLSRKPRGLGDTIAKITAATGIAAAVKAVSKATGTDCGCQQRQKKLNEMFPYQ